MNTWPRSGQKSAVLACVLLLAFAVYANTLLNGFVYDDHHQIEQNPYVQSGRYIGRILTTTVWSFQGAEGQTNYYRPLMTLTFLVCNQLFQGLPYGFHLVNILLNCLVVALVFVVASRLFEDEAVALLAAAIFALHPIHTEVGAWIAAVTELELAIFYLAAFVLFLRLGAATRRQRTTTQLLMCGSFVLALLSKEQAMTLLVLAVAYEHFYRSDRAVTNWKIKVCRYGWLWTIGCAYVIFRATVLGAFAPVMKHADVTGVELLFSGLALVGQYVGKLIWPHPLLAFYVFHKSVAINDPRVLLGVAVVLGSGLLFFLLWRRARAYSFMLLWIAVTLAPVLNARWLATNVFTERYLYLPSIGFCVLTAGAFVCLYRKAGKPFPSFRWILSGVGIALALLAGTRIVARNRIWRDDWTLLTRTLAIEPHASYMRNDLGVLQWERQNRDEAEQNWRRSLEDMPDNPVALSNLGLAMLEKKEYQKAREFLQESIALRPRYAQPHIHLGRMYVAEHQTAAAEAEFRKAVEIYPLSTQARNALGKFYFESERLGEAEEQYRASTESLANDEAWSRLGDIYSREGRKKDAEHAWQEVLRLAPYDVHAHLALGNLYFAQGRAAEAQKEYRNVLLVDPGNSEARDALQKLGANNLSSIPSSFRR